MATKPPSHKLAGFGAAPSRHYDRVIRMADPGLRQSAAFRSSSRWQKLRLAFISSHPLCADPHGLHGPWPPAASEVHHVASLHEAPDKAADWENLMALCHDCHSIFSLEERARQTPV